jgi:RNA polymerase sigma factor (sigma-70 family)
MATTALKRSPPLLRSPRLLSALGDQRLFHEAKRGNDAAFEVIYDRYHRQLLAFCRHMLGSREDAEDVLQLTFASAFRALPDNEQSAHLRPWLYTIARNRSLTLLRARREHPSDEVEKPSFEGLADEVERRAELKQILLDLNHLPERQRAALVLAEVSDLSHAEVAQVLDCDPNQVKGLVFQARTALAHDREARAIPCVEIREEIAGARGRKVRRSLPRRHIRSCSGCAEFEREVRRQRELLAIALPVIPSLWLKDATLAAAGIGGGGAAGGAAGGGGGLIAALGVNGAAKVAAVAAVAGGAVGGVAATDPGVVEAARSGIARAVSGVTQAASGELDRKQAQREEARSRRQLAAAVQAEREKGRSGTGSANGSSGNGDSGGAGQGNSSDDAGRVRGGNEAAAGQGSELPQGTSRGRSGTARGSGPPSRGSARSGRRGRGVGSPRSGNSDGRGPLLGRRINPGRRLSPRRVLRPAPQVGRGARGGQAKRGGNPTGAQGSSAPRTSRSRRP